MEDIINFQDNPVTAISGHNTLEGKTFAFIVDPAEVLVSIKEPIQITSTSQVSNFLKDSSVPYYQAIWWLAHNNKVTLFRLTGDQRLLTTVKHYSEIKDFDIITTPYATTWFWDAIQVMNYLKEANSKARCLINEFYADEPITDTHIRDMARLTRVQLNPELQ